MRRLRTLLIIPTTVIVGFVAYAAGWGVKAVFALAGLGLAFMLALIAGTALSGHRSAEPVDRASPPNGHPDHPILPAPIPAAIRQVEAPIRSERGLPIAEDRLVKKKATEVKKTESGLDAVYEVYESATEAAALDFLRGHDVPAERHYVIVETPQRNLGRDMIMIFDEADGALIEFPERTALFRPRSSLTNCARCGYVVVPMRPPDLTSRHTLSVQVVHSLDEMRMYGFGFQCPSCHNLACASCYYSIREKIPKQANGALRPTCWVCAGPVRPLMEGAATSRQAPRPASIAAPGLVEIEAGTSEQEAKSVVGPPHRVTETEVYTYLLQVLPKGGGKWANLLEPRTGTPVDGTFGTVDAAEGGLSDAAREIMKRYSRIELKRRVVFWEGRRVNEKLYSSEIFRTIYDDGEITDAEAEMRKDDDGSTQHPGSVRTECPHAPHDGSCGHEGPCMYAHHGRECEAVRPVCPACLGEERPATVPGIVGQVRRDGDVVLRCSSCEQLSFRLDADLICDTCQWLVPHVNEELEERFAANGGRFSPAPGSCPGCSHQMPHPPGPFTFGCPRCGRSVILSLDSVTPGHTVTTMCPNEQCRQYITIPPSIWCPECGQNLRPLNVIRRLTLAANDLRLETQSNVREDETIRFARRLAEAAEAIERKYKYRSEEQQRLLHDKRYLDSIASSAKTPEEWIRGAVEIRAAGHELNRQGGMHAMREVHQRVMELGRGYRGAARLIEVYWDGIGDWLG